MRQTTKLSLLASAALVFANPVAAQTATAGPPTPEGPIAANSANQVQEIVVTATRRSENLQKVSGTIEAVPAQTLKAFNITSVLQLPDVTPGLVIAPSGGNNLFLRGVGSPSTGYNEAQIAVYIDGLYLPNPAMSIYSFNNIEQVEVLKGPQGTLYGRNALGGLISVTTRDPGTSERLDVSAGYANYNTLTFNLYGSTPITDTLSANVALYHSKQSDGYGHNIFTGADVDKSDENGVESKLLWRPTSKTKVTATFIFDTNNRDFGYDNQVYPGTVGADGTRTLPRYEFDSRVNPSAPFTSYTGSLKIQQDLGFANLMSLTGYQDSSQVVTFSPSPDPGKPLPGQGAPVDVIDEGGKTWSQEFQLTSAPSDSRFDWVAGTFVYEDQTTIRINGYNTCVGNICVPGFIPTNNVGYPTTLSYSGYGDANYRLFDATHLTVGLRYTDETKRLTGSVAPLAGFPDSVATLPTSTITYPGEPFAGRPDGIPKRLHFDKLTYRVVLAQDFGSNIHAYLSDNLGFKSGAYNANLFTNPPVLPEVLDSYEAGIKTELFDRRLRFNAAYFYYDYTNVQLRSTAPPAPPGNAILENAASEHQRGVDFDFNFVVTPAFSINGGGEFLDSKYSNFPGATCSIPGTKVVNGIVVGAATTFICNQGGYATPFSPPISGSIGFIYKLDTSMGTWSLTANDHFNSRYPLVADDTVKEGPKNIVDAALVWATLDKKYDVQLYVRNLGNEYTYVTGFAASQNTYYVVPGAPQTFGIIVSAHY